MSVTQVICRKRPISYQTHSRLIHNHLVGCSLLAFSNEASRFELHLHQSVFSLLIGDSHGNHCSIGHTPIWPSYLWPEMPREGRQCEPLPVRLVLHASEVISWLCILQALTLLSPIAYPPMSRWFLINSKIPGHELAIPRYGLDILGYWCVS